MTKLSLSTLDELIKLGEQSHYFAQAEAEAILTGLRELRTTRTYPTDRDGWICSVCHGWNVPKDRVCMHNHLPEHLRSPVEPSEKL